MSRVSSASPSGVFISFEGGEAVGKSTQIALLSKALKRRGFKIHITREPGGTRLGEKIRKTIKTQPMTSRAELLLFEACRAELVETVLRPRLALGEIILCDRFKESSLVYQGASRGIPLNQVKTANDLATQGLQSDFIVLLDGRKSIKRMNRRGSKDRIEQEKLDFHKRVAQGYRRLATSDKRFRTYNADLDRQTIHQKILKDVLHFISLKRKLSS